MQHLHLLLPAAYCCACHYALLLDPLKFAAGLCASCDRQRVCMQADAMALVRAAEQRMEAHNIKYAEISRGTMNYMDAAEKRHSQAMSEASKQHARLMQALDDSALSHLQQEQRAAQTAAGEV